MCSLHCAFVHWLGFASPDYATHVSTLSLQSIYVGPTGEVARDVLVLADQCAKFYEQFKQTASARAAALLLPTWLSHAQ